MSNTFVRVLYLFRKVPILDLNYPHLTLPNIFSVLGGRLFHAPKRIARAGTSLHYNLLRQDEKFEKFAYDVSMFLRFLEGIILRKFLIEYERRDLF